MALTLINPIAVATPYATAGALVTLTALDNVNGNQFPCTGHEVVFIQNSDGAAPHTITFTAQPDREGRSNNLTLSCVQSSFYITQLFPMFGWAIGGFIQMPSGQSAQLLIAVLQFTF